MRVIALLTCGVAFLNTRADMIPPVGSSPGPVAHHPYRSHPIQNSCVSDFDAIGLMPLKDFGLVTVGAPEETGDAPAGDPSPLFIQSLDAPSPVDLDEDADGDDSSSEKDAEKGRILSTSNKRSLCPKSRLVSQTIISRSHVFSPFKPRPPP